MKIKYAILITSVLGMAMVADSQTVRETRVFDPAELNGSKIDRCYLNTQGVGECNSTGYVADTFCKKQGFSFALSHTQERVSSGQNVKWFRMRPDSSGADVQPHPVPAGHKDVLKTVQCGR